MSAPLTTQLAAIHAELGRLAGEVRTLAFTSDDARFNRPPAPGAWSAAQCIEHLTVSGRLYLPSFDVTIAEARARDRTAPGPFRHSLLGRLAIWNNEPPPRFRLPAPTRMRPSAPPPAPVPREGVVSEFIAVQREFQQRVADASGLDLSGVRMGSPLAPMVRFSLFDWLGIMTAHERRHIWQARRALGAG